MSVAPQLGSVAIVEGQQSYDITFPVPFSEVPGFFDATIAMASSSGEIFTASADLSTLTETGVTVWLSGIPTSASVGSLIQWYAVGTVELPTISDAGRGMKVVQLFHRLGRHSRGGDFTKLSLSEQTDIINAANAGLMILYNALPTYFKEQTQGFTLPGPLAITGVVVTQYSKIVTEFTFSEDQFGQNVVLDGDGGWNQIIGENELLNPYQGPSGTVGGTIYGNALHSSTFPLDRIIGSPQFPKYNQAPLFAPNVISSSSQGAGWWLYSQAMGIPQTWWPQVFGNSQGKKPIMVLRFAPAPNSAMAVNVRIGFWPKRLSLEDYDNNTELVVPDQFIEPALIPICIQQFMNTPSWVSVNDKSDERIAVAGDKGIAFAKMQLGQIGVPSNRVFTPTGF